MSFTRKHFEVAALAIKSAVEVSPTAIGGEQMAMTIALGMATG